MPEIEIKLTHTDPAMLSTAFDDAALCAATCGDVHTIRMHSEYYDTPDQMLRNAGCTLRFRTENDVGVITLKVKVDAVYQKDGLSVRGEFETTAVSLAEGLIALRELAPDCAELLSAAEPALVMTAAVTFTRVERHAEFDGTQIAFSVDRGYFNGDRTRCFTEFEAELKRGKTETLIAVCDRLSADYGLVPQKESKLKRALAYRT